MDSTELAARMAQNEDTREFAFAVVHNLAVRFACQQVSFGFRRRTSLSSPAFCHSNWACDPTYRSLLRPQDVLSFVPELMKLRLTSVHGIEDAPEQNNQTFTLCNLLRHS